MTHVYHYAFHCQLGNSYSNYIEHFSDDPVSVGHHDAKPVDYASTYTPLVTYSTGEPTQILTGNTDGPI